MGIDRSEEAQSGFPQGYSFSSNPELDRIVDEEVSNIKNFLKGYIPILKLEEQKRLTFEKVCGLECRCLTVEDLERPGGVAEVYDGMRISPDEIELLLTGRMGDFERAVQDGRFVFKYDEEPLDASGKGVGESVAEQMRRDLSSPVRSDGGRYVGFCLVDGKAPRQPIMAYATAVLPPPASASDSDRQRYFDQWVQTLEYGVSRGEMSYDAGVDFKQEILHRLERSIFFDTVAVRCADPGAKRASIPFAASRLFAEMTETLHRGDPVLGLEAHPDFHNFFLYRLDSLRVDPAPEEVRRRCKIGQNMSSFRFFKSRFCVDVATEFNRDGPMSRIHAGGAERLLNPGWRWMVGRWDEVAQQSQKILQEIRKRFQDAA